MSAFVGFPDLGQTFAVHCAWYLPITTSWSCQEIQKGGVAPLCRMLARSASKVLGLLKLFDELTPHMQKSRHVLFVCCADGSHTSFIVQRYSNKRARSRCKSVVLLCS